MEFYFKSTDPDIEIIDERVVSRAGDLATVKADGYSDGPNWFQSAYADTSKFVYVKAPEVVAAQAALLHTPWRDDYGYQITQQNPQKGVYWVRVFEKNSGVSGKNNLTQDKIQRFLYNWNCSELVFDTNECTFKFSLYQAVQSYGFWDLNPRILDGVSFESESYNPETGIGEIRIVVATSPMIPDGAPIQVIQMRGGEVIESNHPEYVFRMHRSVVYEAFKAAVKLAAEKLYRKHRYCVSQNTLDWIAANNGATVTAAQLRGYLIDKMTD